MLPKCPCVWKTLRFEDKRSLSPVCYAHSQPSPCEPLLTWYLLTDSNFAHCEPKPAYSDISCIQTCCSMHCLWSFSLCAGLGNKCLCPSLHLKNWLCYRTKTSQLTVCLYAYNGTIYAPQPALPTTIALEAPFQWFASWGLFCSTACDFKDCCQCPPLSLLLNLFQFPRTDWLGPS